jgi:hypothetical protein
MNKFLLITVTFVAVFALFTACQEVEKVDLTDMMTDTNPDPVLLEIQPAEGVFAGIGECRLIGQNFNTQPAHNYVYFNNVKAEVLSASPTELVVKAPNLVSDSIMVKVGVFKASLFSQPMHYELFAAIEDVYGFKPTEEPLAIAFDLSGNIYFTNRVGGSLDSIKVVRPNSSLETYGPESKEYDVMKIGPTAQLYGLHGTRKNLYRYPAGGGEPDVWADMEEKVVDFDFDQNMNVWAGGSKEVIIRVDPNDPENQKLIEYIPEVTALRVFDGYLYLATIGEEDTHLITRRQILSADSLGPAEVFFDYSVLEEEGDIPEILEMTFSSDGYLYAAVSSSAGLVLIEPDGSSYTPVFPELLDPNRESVSLTWGFQNEPYIYLSRSASYEGDEVVLPPTILKIDTGRPGGAPYFGRGDQ